MRIARNLLGACAAYRGYKFDLTFPGTPRRFRGVSGGGWNVYLEIPQPAVLETVVPNDRGTRAEDRWRITTETASNPEDLKITTSKPRAIRKPGHSRLD
jgi:hypothetical protein